MRRIEGGAAQRGGGVGRQAHDRDVAERRVVDAHCKAGQALIEDARAALVAGIVELARRPTAGAVAPGHGGVRVTDRKARQVKPGAAHERGIDVAQFLAHDAGKAQQLVLLASRQRHAAVAKRRQRRRAGYTRGTRGTRPGVRAAARQRCCQRRCQQAPGGTPHSVTLRAASSL